MTGTKRSALVTGAAQGICLSSLLVVAVAVGVPVLGHSLGFQPRLPTAFPREEVPPLVVP